MDTNTHANKRHTIVFFFLFFFLFFTELAMGYIVETRGLCLLIS